MKELKAFNNAAYSRSSSMGLSTTIKQHYSSRNEVDDTGDFMSCVITRTFSLVMGEDYFNVDNYIANVI